MANILTSDDFSILNKDNKPVVYITDDPSINRMTFKIINATTDVLKLSGGIPVKQGKGGSSFNFNFESILTPKVVEDLIITVPVGWAFAFFPGDATTPASWSVAPVNDVVLNINETVSIIIENIICDTTHPGNFEIMYSNIIDYPDSMFPITKHLAVQKPINPDKKTLPIDTGFTNIIHPINGQTALIFHLGVYSPNVDVPVPIYITYDPQALIENGFTYFWKNTSKDPLVSAAKNENDDSPIVYISFLFGESNDDITSQELGDNNITVDVSAESTNWSTIAHTAGTSYWEILPKSPEIMAGCETVIFPIKKIITLLNTPGNTITTMYIQCNNFPEYNDTNFVLELQKLVAKASADSLTVDRVNINFGESVALNWVTSLAKRVTLSYSDRDGKTIFLDSQQGQIGLNATNFIINNPPPSAEHTIFSLFAYDNSPDYSMKQAIVTVYEPLATIQNFQANPQLVNVLSNPAQTTLTWFTQNADKILLSDPENSFDVTGKTSYLISPLRTTIPYTLSAFAYGDQHPAPTTSIVTIYAYKAEKGIAMPMNGEGMQTLPSILMNNNYGRVYAINSSQSLICDINVNTGVIEKTYPGNVFAVSDDGSKLFVFSGGPNPFGVSIIDVKSGATGGPVGFGPVYAMIVSPDLTRLYCASTHNVSTVTLLMIDKSANTLSLSATINVGMSPRAMVFNADASKLYVANYDSKSISVIKVADNSTTVINLNTSEPLKFAMVNQLGKLYLACEGENYVVVINTTNDTVETPYITVGNRPVDVLASPNGQFIYVANFGSNTISVINTATDTVFSTLTVGAAPSCLALNSDGTVFFVGNYCDKTLSIVDINQNLVLPQTLPTGDSAGNPFDLAVYTENSDYTRVYIAKESFTPRISCVNPNPNSSLDIAVYSIQEPGRSSSEWIVEDEKIECFEES